MTTESSLEILGHAGEPVANRFLRPAGDARHLALVLPGLHYVANLPWLYFPARLLSEMGADVLLLEYDYRTPAFAGASAEERANRMLADVTAGFDRAIAAGAYNRITLVGKSIGTLAIGLLLAARPVARAAACVWLTPLLREERLRRVIAAHAPRSLFVAGSADAHHDPDALAEVMAATGGRSLVIEGGSHGLEIPGDLRGTLAGLTDGMLAIERFLAS